MSCISYIKLLCFCFVEYIKRILDLGPISRLASQQATIEAALIPKVCFKEHNKD